MDINTERSITVIEIPSIVNTFFMPIPLIHGPMARTNAVATILRVTVIVTIESATI
jgi:hypothetical protein